MRIAFSLVSFIFTLCGVLYGAFHLFRKDKPFYFQMLVAAVGCLSFQQLSLLVNYLVDEYHYVSLGELGVFGSLMFLLSAEYSSLNRSENEEKGKKMRADLQAMIAPIVTIGMLIYIFFRAHTLGNIPALLILLILLPTVPVSFFALRNLIYPSDADGFLKHSRMSNFFVLLFVITLDVSTIVLLHSSLWGNMISLLSAVLATLVSFFAVRGDRQWT